MRQAHLGLAAHHGVASTVRAACSLAWSDAKAVVLSPAPVLGLLIGLLLCLAPFARDDAAIRRALPSLLTASWAVAAIGVVAVAMGDLGSYQASWHLLPLIVVVYPACVLTGYALGTRSRAVHLPAAVSVLAVLALAWTTTQAVSAARVSFARARVFDRDVHAAEVAQHDPRAVATWRSMSIAGITDAAPPGPNGFAGNAIQHWLGISAAQLHIVPVAEPDVDLFDW
jgi:small-conductance mechanosensitive channel